MFPAGLRGGSVASATRQGAKNMVERVAVLLGTVQFRLKLKVNLPEEAQGQPARKRHTRGR